MMAPLICMLKHGLHIKIFTMTVAIFWEINQVCSMHIVGCITISIEHVASDWVTFNDFALSGSMTYKNNYGSLNNNMHGLHINRFTMTVTIFWDINQVCRMHIMECMTISIGHVPGEWVTFNDFALSGCMHHQNNYGSLNMHARDMVCISRDSQWQWQYFNIYTRYVACILWDVRPFPWGMLPAIGSYSMILPCPAACLMETIMAHLIYMLETWFASQ